jgi:hypothetical protein
MKRWLLFVYPIREAGGGWRDFVGSYDTPDEAKAAIPSTFNDLWEDWHIVDTAADPPVMHESWGE